MIDEAYENPVKFSAEALKQALAMQCDNPDWQNLPIRIYLDGKGCDGFFYGVSFDGQTSDDIVCRQGTLEIIVDKKTVEFVCDSLITWIDDERGTGFLVENPNHKKFRGKFFKRKNWEEKLLHSPITDPLPGAFQ